jgi:hypothetical protein
VFSDVDLSNIRESLHNLNRGELGRSGESERCTEGGTVDGLHANKGSEGELFDELHIE